MECEQLNLNVTQNNKSVTMHIVAENINLVLPLFNNSKSQALEVICFTADINWLQEK